MGTASWGGPVSIPQVAKGDMHEDYVFETVPVFLVLFDESLDIAFSSSVADAVMGPECPKSARTVMDSASCRRIEEFRQDLLPGQAPEHVMLTFLGRNGLPRRIAGLADMIPRPDGQPLLRFTACFDPRSPHWLENLILSEEVLRGISEASSEAMWCIQFTEPVDLGQGDQEIIRQVFENDCHWLLCNKAMANLYLLPDEMDMTLQPVSLYFPRSPENEAFVRQIIESGFAVNNALSIDFRHDASVLYIENTVRCTISGGRLVRMWGTARDVTEVRQTQNRLVNEVEAVRNILAALPDAILVIDRNRRLVAVNPAFETLLGWSVEHFLGRDVQAVIDLEHPLPGGRRWYGFDQQRWFTGVQCRSGAMLECEAQISPIGIEVPDHFVLSLRPVLEGGAVARGRLSI